MIYRHKEYQQLVQNIEVLQKKIEKQKDAQLFTGGAAKNKTAEKKLTQNESQLKQYQQDLQKVNIWYVISVVPNDIDVFRCIVHGYLHESSFKCISSTPYSLLNIRLGCGSSKITFWAI